jgi:hypothetical protein
MKEGPQMSTHEVPNPNPPASARESAEDVERIGRPALMLAPAAAAA